MSANDRFVEFWGSLRLRAQRRVLNNSQCIGQGINSFIQLSIFDFKKVGLFFCFNPSSSIRSIGNHFLYFSQRETSTGIVEFWGSLRLRAQRTILNNFQCIGQALSSFIQLSIFHFKKVMFFRFKCVSRLYFPKIFTTSTP